MTLRRHDVTTLRRYDVTTLRRYDVITFPSASIVQLFAIFNITLSSSEQLSVVDEPANFAVTKPAPGLAKKNRTIIFRKKVPRPTPGRGPLLPRRSRSVFHVRRRARSMVLFCPVVVVALCSACGCFMISSHPDGLS